MTGRLEEICGFLMFLLTAPLGFFGAAWWAIAAPVLLLGALRYGAMSASRASIPAHEQERVVAMAIAATLLNSAFFVAVAFALGRVIAWLFA